MILQNRLLAKAIPIANCGCLWWTGFVLPNNGYGMIRDGDRMELVHRVSFRLFKGLIPDDKRVLHHCDIPCCIEPEHLFLGTQLDNVHDCIAKGRRAIVPRFAGNPNSKITWDVVDFVRQSGQTHKRLAQQLDVSVSLISKIKANVLWKNEERPDGGR